jgi:hypothetical protein
MVQVAVRRWKDGRVVGERFYHKGLLGPRPTLESGVPSFLAAGSRCAGMSHSIRRA